MTELFIKIGNNYEQLDCENLSMDIIMSLIDILDNSKSQSYSKSFDLFGSERNNRLLGFKYDVNTIDNNKIEYDCFIENDGVRVLEGILKINNIERNGMTIYKCNINSKIQPFFKLLENIKLSDIDWTECDTIYSPWLLEEQFLYPYTGVIYPMIDYNYNFNNNIIDDIQISNDNIGERYIRDNWKTLKPAIFLSKLNDIIFKHLKINYISNFFNIQAKDIVLPYMRDDENLYTSQYYINLNSFKTESIDYSPTFGDADITPILIHQQTPAYMFNQQYFMSPSDDRSKSEKVYIEDFYDVKRNLIENSGTDILYKYSNEPYLDMLSDNYTSILDSVKIEIEFTLYKDYFTDNNDSAIFFKFQEKDQRLKDNKIKLKNVSEVEFSNCDFFHLSDSASFTNCNTAEKSRGYILYLNNELTKNNNTKVNLNNISTIINSSNRDIYKIREDADTVTYKIYLETEKFITFSDFEYGIIFNYIANVEYLRDLKTNDPNSSPYIINKINLIGHPRPSVTIDGTYLSALSIFKDDTKIIDLYRNIFQTFNLIIVYDYKNDLYILEDYDSYMKSNLDIINISNDIDTTHINIVKNLSKNVNLTNSESNSLLTQNYIRDFKYNYGSLIINNNSNINNKYELNTIFESNITSESFIRFNYPLSESCNSSTTLKYIDLKTNDYIINMSTTEIPENWGVSSGHTQLVNINNVDVNTCTNTKRFYETSMSKLKDDQINLLFNDNTSDNLYQRYHKKYVELFNSDESMMVTLNVNISPYQFSKIKYNTIIRIDNLDSSSSSNLFYINKLTYNPSKTSQQIELIKILDTDFALFERNVERNYKVEFIDLNSNWIELDFKQIRFITNGSWNYNEVRFPPGVTMDSGLYTYQYTEYYNIDTDEWYFQDDSSTRLKGDIVFDTSITDRAYITDSQLCEYYMYLILSIMPDNRLYRLRREDNKLFIKNIIGEMQLGLAYIYIDNDNSYMGNIDNFVDVIGGSYNKIDGDDTQYCTIDIDTINTYTFEILKNGVWTDVTSEIDAMNRWQVFNTFDDITNWRTKDEYGEIVETGMVTIF